MMEGTTQETAEMETTRRGVENPGGLVPASMPESALSVKDISLETWVAVLRSMGLSEKTIGDASSGSKYYWEMPEVQELMVEIGLASVLRDGEFGLSTDVMWPNVHSRASAQTAILGFRSTKRMTQIESTNCVTNVCARIDPLTRGGNAWPNPDPLMTQWNNGANAVWSRQWHCHQIPYNRIEESSLIGYKLTTTPLAAETDSMVDKQTINAQLTRVYRTFGIASSSAMMMDLTAIMNTASSGRMSVAVPLTKLMLYQASMNVISGSSGLVDVAYMGTRAQCHFSTFIDSTTGNIGTGSSLAWWPYSRVVLLQPLPALATWSIGVGAIRLISLNEFNRVVSLGTAALAAIPVGFRPNTWGVSTAVVPVTRDQLRLLSQADDAIWLWVLSQMEYPIGRFTTFTTSALRTKDPTVANVAREDWVTPLDTLTVPVANCVHIPGPNTNILFVSMSDQATRFDNFNLAAPVVAGPFIATQSLVGGAYQVVNVCGDDRWQVPVPAFAANGATNSAGYLDRMGAALTGNRTYNTARRVITTRSDALDEAIEMWKCLATDADLAAATHAVMEFAQAANQAQTVVRNEVLAGANLVTDGGAEFPIFRTGWAFMPAMTRGGIFAELVTYDRSIPWSTCNWSVGGNQLTPSAGADMVCTLMTTMSGQPMGLSFFDPWESTTPPAAQATGLIEIVEPVPFYMPKFDWVVFLGVLAGYYAAPPQAVNWPFHQNSPYITKVLRCASLMTAALDYPLGDMMRAHHVRGVYRAQMAVAGVQTNVDSSTQTLQQTALHTSQMIVQRQLKSMCGFLTFGGKMHKCFDYTAWSTAAPRTPVDNFIVDISWWTMMQRVGSPYVTLPVPNDAYFGGVNNDSWGAIELIPWVRETVFMHPQVAARLKSVTTPDFSDGKKLRADSYTTAAVPAGNRVRPDTEVFVVKLDKGNWLTMKKFLVAEGRKYYPSSRILMFAGVTGVLGDDCFQNGMHFADHSWMAFNAWASVHFDQTVLRRVTNRTAVPLILRCWAGNLQNTLGGQITLATFRDDWLSAVNAGPFCDVPAEYETNREFQFRPLSAVLPAPWFSVHMKQNSLLVDYLTWSEWSKGTGVDGYMQFWAINSDSGHAPDLISPSYGAEVSDFLGWR